VFWGGVQNGMNGFQHDATMYARAVQCPVLLLCGEKDARVTRSEFLRVAAQIQGKVKTVVLPGVGHQSYCRATPELYRRTVSEWLVSTER
jgi:pimeloyl-ACP methyl ester carboxylesterase